MAITVRKLFKNATLRYQMKLIGGKDGLNNLVQWVHIIEDDDVSKFLHGQELVFTAGILNQGGDWLLHFARRLYGVGISALVINIGPHTKAVPKEVIAFCDQVKMPLFTIPWETRMVDMTRDFCKRIMQNDNMEQSMSSTLKNIIFGEGDLETQIQHMERHGYQRDERFCFVAIATGEEKEGNVVYSPTLETLKQEAEGIARSMHELYIAFEYSGMLILGLIGYSSYDIEDFIEKYQQAIKKVKCPVYIGISSNSRGISHQRKNYSNAVEALHMAENKKEKVIFYDHLGVYKLLLSVDDKMILKAFYEETVGKLAYYDKENHTELCDFLKVYLDNNGSPQLVAEKQYIHRNTVTNQLKKIEKITGLDPLHLEDRIKFMLAYYIQEIV